MTPECTPRSVALARGLFRRLSALTPRGFRHREEALDLMARLLADAHRDRGARGVAAVTASAVLDLLARLPAIYARAHAGALRRDVPYALRTLRRRPLSTAAAVATLTVGIGLNAAVFSLVDWVLLRPLPYPAPQELVRVLSAGTAPVTGPTSVSFPEFLALSQATSLRASAAFSTATRVISGPGLEPTHVVVARVAGDLFGTLGVHPSTGRGFDRSEAVAGSAIVVLSDALCRRHFSGDPAIVGRTITIDRQAHTVVGVMPAGRGYPRDADLWRPLTREEQDGDRELVMLGRLASGTPRERASLELATLASGASAASRSAWVEDLQRTEVRDVRSALVALLASSAVVLLLACANVAALVGARGAERESEIAVRGALGASRAALLQQLLTENVLLAAAGGAAGLLLGTWTLDLLVAVAPAGVPRLGEITLDGRVMAVCVGATLLVGVVVGVAPAYHASRLDVAATLGVAGSLRTSGRARGRRLLVAGQMAMALVLTMSAGLLARSLQHLVTVDHGFNADRLIAVDLYLRGGVTTNVRALYQDLIAASETIPGVQAAAIALRLPTQTAGLRVSVRGDGILSSAPAVATLRPVTARYFEATGIAVTGGRAFDARDQRSAPRVAIVNAAFVHDVLGGGRALGVSMTTDLFDGRFSTSASSAM